MAIITGSDCGLTINQKDYGDVVSSFELTSTTDSLTYPTLKGQKAGPGKESAKLSVTFAYDSGATDSLFDALWSNVGKDVAFVATAGQSTFSGNVIAVRPSVPAKAGEVSEVTVEMDVDGQITKAQKPAGKA